jgi:hypothetical protein
MLSPLRNRFGKRLREPFGKAGLTVAILALVMAMVGGAWAAVGLNGKQKKEVTTIAKKYAGKPGATGPQGPAGTNGTNGTNGEKGAKGDTGANGKSVAVTPIAKPGCSGNGGAEVKQEDAASGVEVCNGEPGVIHPGETLPPGATETGAWGFEEEAPLGEASTAISFPIQLVESLDASHVHYLGLAATPTSECPGSPVAPQAETGNLCVYTTSGSFGSFLAIVNAGNTTLEGAATAGAFIKFEAESGFISVKGTFAVTG